MSSHKKSIKSKVSDQKLKENSYFILKILLVILVILVLLYYIKNELNTEKKENFFNPTRLDYTPEELYKISTKINNYINSIKELQDNEYYNVIDDEIIKDLLSELKDETNQKDIRLKSSVGIYQSLQDEDIKSIKENLDKIKKKIDDLKNKKNNKENKKLKHIPSGAVLHILNKEDDTGKTHSHVQISKDLNTCLEYDNKHTHDKISDLIEDEKEINNIKLEHCDFDKDEQRIIVSDKIDSVLGKDNINDDFNKQLHEDCMEYSKLGPHSKLNNYPFYHVHPEPMNNEPKKKYCLDIENGHGSFQKCSGKTSQRFQLI
tara:strand:- start:250 stop:1203 length:954 start_codon:yes stop_codon:yes gene_type:complete